MYRTSAESRRRLLATLLSFTFSAAFVSIGLRAGLPQAPGVATAPALPALEGDAALAHLKREGMYSSLAEAVEAARYSAQPFGEDSFRLVNPAHGFQATFRAESESGVSVSTDDDGSNQELTLKLTGYGYGSRLVGLAREDTQAHENRVEHVHRPQTEGSPLAITEWFVNRPEGVEHGFVLPAPPAVAREGDRLRLGIEIGGAYRAELDPETGTVMLEAAGRSSFTYDKLHVSDAEGRVLDSRFELEGSRLAIVIDDREAAFPITIDPLIARETELTAGDGRAKDHFGRSLAMSGKRVVIGAPEDDVVGTDEGSVYIFVRSGSEWIQEARLNAVDGMDANAFGSAVAISRDTVLVGAPFAGNLAGAAYVFVRDGSTWIYEDKLVASGGEPFDLFGVSVAVLGDTALVGAPNHDLAGAAFVFMRQGGLWTEEAKLSPASPGAFFGFSVALDLDTAVVGAPAETIDGNVNQGSAYVFVRDAGLWTEQARLNADNGASDDYFGWSVGISGDTLLVGAPSHDNGANQDEGAAYVFVQNGALWSQQQKLTPAEGEPGERFGVSVALAGDTAVAGATGKDLTFEDQGAAYVFGRTDDTWSQQQRLFPANGHFRDQAGNAVALSGDTIVVGLENDDVGGNLDQGSARVFVLCRGDWTREKRLSADDAGAEDLFGSSIAMSGDTVVVGAPWDDIGGNENQGSAYVFVRSGTTWSQQQKLTASDGEPEDFFGVSVAVGGDFLVVGAPLAEMGQGAAYVFVRSGTNWSEQQELTASNGELYDLFGRSVAISGDTVVVGAYLDEIDGNSLQGSAYVFVRSGTTWSQQQKLTAIDGDAADQFGWSVAISGDTVVVGAYYDDIGGNEDQGSAYVFVRSGTNWSELQKLVAEDGEDDDAFGVSVAISGDKVAVGAFHDDIEANLDQGSTYFFVRSGALWSQQQKLVAGNGQPFDGFGNSVAISEDTVIVGAPSDSGGRLESRGSARVFRLRCLDCPRIQLEPGTFPGGTVGSSYNAALTADGGEPPYNYSLSRGSLPPGLTFVPTTGLLSGTPTTAGKFPFVITATDAELCTGSRRYRIVVEDLCPAIRLLPRRLPEGREGEPYQEPIIATGGVAPYGFSVTGALPSGLTLSPDGLLSGTPTADGTFDIEIQATDADGCAGARAYTLTIQGGNQPPLADAGPDQSVPAGSTVTLDASASSDPDGDPLTFSWTFLSVPQGTTAVLSDPTAVNPSFLVDRPGSYEIQLIVNDGRADSAPDIVIVSTQNSPPTADAGPDQSAFVGDTVTLDGSASSDPDGDPLTFLWTFLSRPPGSAAALSDPTAVSPSFSVDQLGDYVLQLIVNDGRADSAPDVVTISTENRPPVADAGADQTVTAGMTVQLDGSASFDPDGTPVAYSWSLTSQPPSSTATLSDPMVASPSFVADLPGVYIAELRVNDGELESAPDAVAITAIAPLVSLAATDPDAAEAGPDPGSFTFSRTRDTSFPLTVAYRIERGAGIAENGVDYALISENITIPVGAAEVVLTIAPVDDTVPEGDENVVLTLVDGAAYDLGADVSGTVVIADDDPPVVILTANDPDSSEEGPAPGSFLLQRNGPTTDPLTVFYDIDNSGAENGVDYQTIATSATIPAGELNVTITILPIDDPDIEGREDVVLTLAPGAGYLVGSPNTAFVRIEDNDFPVVTIRGTDDAAEAGRDPGTFTVSRLGPTADALEVFYLIAGDARNGIDYDTIPENVTIPSGATSANVIITPVDDPDVEGTESVVLSLRPDPAYVVDAPGIANIIIADNDLPVVTVVADDPIATEAGATTGSFTFSRTGGTGTALPINVSRAGTANSGADYAENLGVNFVFTIPAGQSQATLTITPLADNRLEPVDETVELTINDTLQYVVGTPRTATVFIEDDPAIVNVEASDADASEAGPDPGVFRFTRAGGDVAASLSVSFSLGGTAADNTDYVFLSGSVVIPAGQSSAEVTVTPRQDNRVEGLESVVATLNASSNYLVGPSPSATVNIADDPPVVTVVATDPDASETDSDPGVFTFTRNGGNVTAQLQIIVARSGSADNGVDYVSIGGASFVVTFPANQTTATVTIIPFDDQDPEPIQDVILTISPSPSYQIGVPGTATVNITDNDG